MTFLLDSLDPHGNGHASGHTSGHESGQAPVARSVARLGDSRRVESRLTPRMHPVEVAVRRPDPSSTIPSGTVPAHATSANDNAAFGDLPTLLRICPADARQFFAGQVTRRSIAAGTVLAKIAEPCQKLLFVEDGLVDVQGPPTGPIMAGAAGPILRRGDFYGSHAIDPTATHTVTLTTLTDATICELPAEALRAACERFASARRWIDAVMGSRPLTNMLRRLAESMPGDEEHLLQFAEQFTSVSIPSGQCVQEAGARIDALRLVEEGVLEATAPAAASHETGRLILGPSSLVAVSPLLLSATSPWKFTATADTRLLELPRAALAELLRAAPSLRGALAHLTALGRDVRGPGSGNLAIDRSCPAEGLPRGTDDLQLGGSLVRPSWWQRVPFRRQREQMDCGAACLRTVHAHFGQEMGYREARQLARVSRYGTSLLDLREAAERLGYVAAGVEAKTWDALEAVHLPAIAHVDKNHFVVVWRVSSRGVQISDPALGKVRMPKDEFMARYGGFLLLLRPTDAVGKPSTEAAQTNKRREREFSWWRLLPFARPHLRVLVYILLASVLLQVFGLVTPLLTQVIIDRVIGHGESGLLNVVFAALVCATAFSALVGFSRNHLMIHASLAIERTLLEAVYQRVLSMAHSFFSRFTTGDLVRRFGEVEEVKNFITGNAVTILLDLLMVVTYGAFLVWMQPALSGVYLAILGLSAVVGYVLARPVRGHVQGFMQKFATVNTHVIDSFRGIDPVKAMALERPFATWFTRMLLPALEHGRKAAAWALASGVFIQLIDGVNSGLVLWRGAYLVLGGAVTLGQLMAFLMLSRQLTGPFLRLLGTWGDLQRTIVSLNRVGDLLEETPEVDQQQSRGAMLELEALRGDIRFENLCFRYSSDPKDATRNVIDDLTVHISPGEVLGIVGRSGCGKSTLARLLLRFEEPSSGRITLDGIHLRDLDPRSLRRQIGLVTQEAVLYSGTIRDNIVCGRDEVTEDDMVHAAQAAGAYEFICDLPYGFETRIGDQGMKLSGGQSQRIVIARALCTNPQILIFDEATAALDPLVERDIHQGLREVIRGRTTIIIAHRLHTLRRADRILVLDRGRLVEQGNHEALMETGGLYRRMYTASPDWQGNSEPVVA